MPAGMTARSATGDGWACTIGGAEVICQRASLASGASATIVLVVTASSHRQAAFDSCAFLMDWLKTKAPFWKCEEMADGSENWVDARESDDAGRGGTFVDPHLIAPEPNATTVTVADEVRFKAMLTEACSQD